MALIKTNDKIKETIEDLSLENEIHEDIITQDISDKLQVDKELVIDYLKDKKIFFLNDIQGDNSIYLKVAVSVDIDGEKYWHFDNAYGQEQIIPC